MIYFMHSLQGRVQGGGGGGGVGEMGALGAKAPLLIRGINKVVSYLRKINFSPVVLCRFPL